MLGAPAVTQPDLLKRAKPAAAQVTLHCPGSADVLFTHTMLLAAAAAAAAAGTAGTLAIEAPSAAAAAGGAESSAIGGLALAGALKA